MYVVLLLACAALAVAAPGPAAPKQLNSRLDSVDVDKILANPRVLSNYVKCVTDKGPCTSEGKDLKSEYIFNSWNFSLVFPLKTKMPTTIVYVRWNKGSEVTGTA